MVAVDVVLSEEVDEPAPWADAVVVVSVVARTGLETSVGPRVATEVFMIGATEDARKLPSVVAEEVSEKSRS